MKEMIKWCCVNYEFSNPMILEDSLKWKRTDSIKWFISGTRQDWRHWRKIGWKCVRVKVTIHVLEESK